MINFAQDASGVISSFSSYFGGRLNGVFGVLFCFGVCFDLGRREFYLLDRRVWRCLGCMFWHFVD